MLKSNINHADYSNKNNDDNDEKSNDNNNVTNNNIDNNFNDNNKNKTRNNGTAFCYFDLRRMTKKTIVISFSNKTLLCHE